MLLLSQDRGLTADDLTKWTEKASSRSTPYEKEHPGDAFFTSSETRDTYCVPYNEHVCLIDLAAFPEGDPVEGLEYSKRTELVPSEGNVFQLLLSKDQERLAVTSAYALEALKSGVVSPAELAEPGDGVRPMGLVTIPVTLIARCIQHPVCREGLRKGIGSAAKWAGTSAAWMELMRLLKRE